MYEVNLSKGGDHLSALIRDLKRAAAKRQFEPTPDGKVLVGGHVNLSIGGVFTSWIQRHELVQRAIDAGDKEKEAWARKLARGLSRSSMHNYFDDQLSAEHNIIPDEGLNYILDVIFGASAKINTLYQGPFTENVTPNYSWTGLWAAPGDDQKAAELPADYYDEGVRQAATFSTAASKSITTPNPAVFTISDQAVPSVDVYGSTLNQSSVVGTSTVGKKLIAATAFTIPKQGLGEGDLLKIVYTISAATS